MSGQITHPIFQLSFFCICVIFVLGYFTPNLILHPSWHVHQCAPRHHGARHGSIEDKEWNQTATHNVPRLDFLMNQQTLSQKGINCSKFPTLYDIHFSNLHYQVQATDGNETYFLYSAYLDTRLNTSNRTNDSFYVRIIAMVDRPKLTETNASLRFCQFWFEKNLLPAVFTVAQIKMLWYKEWGTRTGHYYPYLITCRLPQDLKQGPISVSVVPQSCSNATNSLLINHRHRFKTPWNRSKPNGIAVCVKGLDFPHSGNENRFVEWIEALRFFGVKKIFFYEYFVNSKLRQILDYYTNEGIVDVTKITLPGIFPNHAKIRHLYIKGMTWDQYLTEIVPYNDCFYRNIYDYEYISPLDVDEIIVPLRNLTWPSLIQTVIDKEIRPKNVTVPPSICFVNIFFSDQIISNKSKHIPKYFHMLSHINRAEKADGLRVATKCIHNTQHIVGVHNHYAFLCMDGNLCPVHHVKKTRARKHHYRPGLLPWIKNVTAYNLVSIEDTSLLRYEKDIIRNVDNSLRKMSHIRRKSFETTTLRTTEIDLYTDLITTVKSIIE